MHLTCPNCGCTVEDVEAPALEALRCPDCGSTLRPAAEKTGPWLAAGGVGKAGPIELGQTISHYRILDRLGGGGMGVVYQAQDTRLGRHVALKFLPEQHAEDRQALERFRREARTASELNHPHICTIFDIGEHEDQPFIVMELLEGQTLKHRIAGKPLPTDELLELGIQIADALDAAHAHGIVHRDIKPANLFVTRRGQAKVLDFGLAKLVAARQHVGAAPQPLTEDEEGPLSSPGTVLGTVAYMSPEQARGQELDARTDLFSFGVVLYEMATGRRPFQGNTSAVLFDAILNKTPTSPLQLNHGLPVELEHIINKALEKDRDVRCQTAGELRADLRRLKRDTDSGRSGGGRVTATVVQLGPQQRLSRKLLGSAALLVLMIISVGTVWLALFRPGSGPSGAPPESEASSRPPAPPLLIVPFTSYPGDEFDPAFSPDGNQIAFVWNGERGDDCALYTKLIDGGTPLRLTAAKAGSISSPAWSPDGRRIAFGRLHEGEAGIFIVSAHGGPKRQLLSDPALLSNLGVRPSLDWSADGKFLAFPYGNAITLLALDTLKRQQLTTPPPQSNGDGNPVFSPDGKTLAFIRTGSFMVQDIYLVPVAGGEPTRLTYANLRIEGLAWTPDGREIVFSSSRAGRLLRISASGGGRPEQLAGVGENAVYPSIARHGQRLAFTQRFQDTNIWRIEVAGPDVPPGLPTRTRLISSTREENAPQFSPDGKRITFQSNRSGSWEIWICDSDGANPVQLTSFRGPETGTPRWSPDGRQIAFDSRAPGYGAIYVINTEGGLPRQLTWGPSDDRVPSWSRDPRWIYFSSNRGRDRQIWKVPAGGGELVQVTEKGGYAAFESPDGKFVYFLHRGKEGQEMWRVPVEGGKETLVDKRIQPASWADWTVLDNGIYFLTPKGTSGSRPEQSISFFSFETREVTQIAVLDKELSWGFSVSPDRRYILYVQIDQSGRDIMLVENFR